MGRNAGKTNAGLKMKEKKNKTESIQNFLSLEDLPLESLQTVLWNAYLFKQAGKAAASIVGNSSSLPLAGRMLALLFTKNSTRTRLAFERSIVALGGSVSFLSSNDIQLSRGEPLTDTLRVLSGYTDGVVVRMGSHQLLEEASAQASVPVVNALTDLFHPTEALADALTMVEVMLVKAHKNNTSEIDDAYKFVKLLSNKNASGETPKACFVGDANNVSRSFALVCHLLGMHCEIATPEGGNFPHLPTILKKSSTVKFVKNPFEAARNANFIYTDTWISMGSEEKKALQRKKLANYAVNNKLVSQAKNDYVFMHCLPAYRGEEVTAEIIDGKHSYVFAQSENRMHTIKALLQQLYC